MDRISQLDAYLDRYGLTRQRQPLALKHLAGITRKKMTFGLSGWDLSTIGLAMRQMLLGSCASPQRMVSGLQGRWALSARAVRWRFEEHPSYSDAYRFKNRRSSCAYPFAS